MKGILFILILLNVLLLGAVGGYAIWRTDDAQWFVSTYNGLSREDRELTRRAPAIIKRIPSATDAEVEKLLVNDELRARFAKGGGAEEIQQLLVDATFETISGVTERQREEQMSIERFKMRRDEYRDFEKRLEQERAKIDQDRKDFEEHKAKWLQVQKDERLNQLVKDIDDSKEVDMFREQLVGRGVQEQIFVLSKIEDGTKRATLFNLLPADQQDAIKARDLNILGIPNASMGGKSAGTGPGAPPSSARGNAANGVAQR